MDEKKSRHTARRHHVQARLAVRLHQHADDGGQLWLPNFDMNEQVKMNKHIPENLASFKDDISKQKHWMQPVSECTLSASGTSDDRHGLTLFGPERNILKYLLICLR
ncbi:hypothetical protein OBE_11336, partial [human gut metagenome]